MTLDPSLQRWWFLGCSGSGKTTWAARVAERCNLMHYELDGTFHQPGWTSLSSAEMLHRTREYAAGDAWVIDGNYSSTRPVLAQRPTVVISMDLPRRRVMTQIVRRSLRRVLRREELWNGNRESWTSLMSWSPESSVIRWAYTQWPRYRERSTWLATYFSGTNTSFISVRSHDELREVLRSEFGLEF